VTSGKVERRKFDRFPVPRNQYYVFDHDSTEMAEIRDIGKRGLKLEYAPAADMETDWKIIDIFTQDHKQFHLLEIPCKLIYEIISLAEDYSFSGAKIRIAGLKFETLSKEQIKKLEALLNKFS